MLKQMFTLSLHVSIMGIASTFFITYVQIWGLDDMLQKPENVLKNQAAVEDNDNDGVKVDGADEVSQETQNIQTDIQAQSQTVQVPQEKDEDFLIEANGENSKFIDFGKKQVGMKSMAEVADVRFKDRCIHLINLEPEDCSIVGIKRVESSNYRLKPEPVP